MDFWQIVLVCLFTVFIVVPIIVFIIRVIVSIGLSISLSRYKKKLQKGRKPKTSAEQKRVRELHRRTK